MNLPRFSQATLLLLLALAGCAKASRSLVAPSSNELPTSSLTIQRAAAGTFTATLALDVPKGARILYALDPAADQPIRWLPAASNQVLLTLARRDARPYVLLAKTVNVDGSESTVVRHEFTADGVVAQARITSPRPTHQQPITTPPTFRVLWTGTDPEGPGGRPAGYLTRLALASEINPDTLAITAAMVQAFFADDVANHRSAWTETADSSQLLSNQPANTVAYFAVAALDAGGEPGAVETTFNEDRNVLRFRPTVMSLGPDLTVTSDRFNVTLFVARLDPTPSASTELRAGNTLDVEWSAVPDVGRQMDGYRWALDPSSLDDPTVRRNERDVEHWSDWSTAVTGATIGPFSAGDAKKPPHLLYVEARDDLGGLALVVIEIRVLGKARPTGQLLLVDDMYGTTTERNPNGTFNYKAPYPMEAEQDSFYNAVGGFPDAISLLGVPHRGEPGALSLAGAFAGFDYDTLDYRFWPEVGISILERYRAIAWYTDAPSASRSGSKFGSATPATALREINRGRRANQLAEYVANGGKVWLFGEGATTAIANGFWSRFGAGAARLPYTSGDDPRENILRPGNFLYDFIHLRSELWTAGSFTDPQGTADQQLRSCIPYLPQYAGPATQDDRSHDPRIGAGAARTAERWYDLPPLTIANYRTADANPALRRAGTYPFVITKPLSITEERGHEAYSTLDTLYLCQARVFDPLHERFPASDGFPNAVHYHGSDNGEVVWFGFSLYFFELDQARQVVGAVMRNFGIDPLPPGVRQGPGAAEPPDVSSDPAIAQRMR